MKADILVGQLPKKLMMFNGAAHSLSYIPEIPLVVVFIPLFSFFLALVNEGIYKKKKEKSGVDID